jgi:peptidoglycan biosynthesis protein MviN/MurJ (putative lipid II flippase)
MLLKTGVLSLSLLLVSRLLGLVRESVQAAAFGTTGMGDVAVLMLTLPDWLAGVTASGALAYVLLPHWATQTPDQQAHSQRRVAHWLLTLGTALAVTLFFFQDQLALLLVGGIPLHLLPQAARGLAWSALSVPAAMLAALWTIRLQHERDFVGMLSANLVVNGVVIIGLLLIAGSSLPLGALGALAISLSLAMGLRLLWLHSRLGAFRPGNPHAAAQTVPMPATHLWLWAAFSAGLPMTLSFVARTYASSTGEGALATFNYAWKLVELPLMLAVQLVATLVFPAITRAITASPAHVNGVHTLSEEAIQTIRGAFLLAWTLACASIVGLQIGVNVVANMLFGWGRMPTQGVATVAAWSAIGAWSLLPQALIAVTLTVLATLGRMRVVAVAYGAALLALLMLGAWSHGDGATMMGWLTAVLTMVALLVLLDLRSTGLFMQQGASFLPWRAMLVPTVAMLGVTLAARWGWVVLQSLTAPGAIALCAVSAIGVVAISYFSSRELRDLLRRY